jgi:hypothetical protein
LYRFLLISSLLLFVSKNSYAANSSIEKPLPSLLTDASIEEGKSFIEKGTSILPVTPEVSKKKIELDLPLLPKPVDEPDVSESKKPDAPATAPTAKPLNAPNADAKLKIVDKSDSLPLLPPLSNTSPAAKSQVDTQTKVGPAPTTIPVKQPNMPPPIAPASTTTPTTTPVIAQPEVNSPSPQSVNAIQQPNAPLPITPAVPLEATINSPSANITPPIKSPKIVAPKAKLHIIERKQQAVIKPVRNQPPKEIQAVKKPVIDPIQERFVRDEVLLLSFNEDDIILGELSDKASLDQMAGAAYIRLYEQSIENLKYRNKARNNTWFILSHAKEDSISLPKKSLFKIAVNDIEKSNLTDLRVLADNYSILDMTDKIGNNLLHIASFNNKPAIVKWLIMKGIDINMLNEKGASSLDIAENRQYWRIYNLLEQAGAQQ